MVLFSAVPGRYQILCVQCDNIECACTAVTFKLKEVRPGESRGAKAREIQIRVDVPTWQEIESPGRSAAEAALVAEFLRDYPVSEREQLMAWYDERERIVRRLQECRVDPAKVENGRLFSFREILQPPNNPYWDCPLGEHEFSAGDADYLVQESFCLNPACDCNEAHLSFYRLRPDPDSPGTQVAEEEFTARMSLDGRLRLGRCDADRRSKAKRVVVAWGEETNASDLETLRWRYEKIREIGRRSMSGHVRHRPLVWQRTDMDVEELEPPSHRVGRNDPCPCGSGKKYKKCCARRDESAL
jgi:hypothetical protein